MHVHTLSSPSFTTICYNRWNVSARTDVKMHLHPQRVSQSKQIYLSPFNYNTKKHWSALLWRRIYICTSGMEPLEPPSFHLLSSVCACIHVCVCLYIPSPLPLRRVLHMLTVSLWLCMSVNDWKCIYGAQKLRHNPCMFTAPCDIYISIFVCVWLWAFRVSLSAIYNCSL